jgi:hypothetical protein
MSLEFSITAFARLLALSLVIQTVEAISLTRRQDVRDLWDWTIQRNDLGHASVLVQKLFAFLFKDQIHFINLILRLCAALSLVIAPHAVAAIFLFISTVILLIRWRGAFNGGSDFMTLVTVTGLLIGTCASSFVDLITAWSAAFWYVTIHSVSSYFMSGAVKLLNQHWRRGSALTHFLDGGLYGPLKKQSLFKNPLIAKGASWAFILWEISFPSVLFDVDLAIIYCVVAFIFHLLVFRFFGLNRCVWAWVATFPAILYCAGRL